MTEPTTFLQIPVPRFADHRIKVTVQEGFWGVDTTHAGSGVPVMIWRDRDREEGADATDWPNVYLGPNERMIIERLP